MGKSAVADPVRREPRLDPDRQRDPTPVADAIRRAGGKLKSMRSSSSMSFDGPTPERLAQAGADARFGSAVRSVEIIKGGRPQVEQIRVPRVRDEAASDPLTLLAQRGMLDPSSEDMNRWLRQAGERYRSLHQIAGGETLKGMDPTKGFTTGAPGQSTAPDRRIDAWHDWNKANRAMSDHCRRTVDDIVLHGVKPDCADLSVCRYRDRKSRLAVIMTFLQLGLLDLDRHFAEVDKLA